MLNSWPRPWPKSQSSKPLSEPKTRPGLGVLLGCALAASMIGPAGAGPSDPHGSHPHGSNPHGGHPHSPITPGGSHPTVITPGRGGGFGASVVTPDLRIPSTSGWFYGEGAGLYGEGSRRGAKRGDVIPYVFGGGDTGCCGDELAGPAPAAIGSLRVEGFASGEVCIEHRLHRVDAVCLDAQGSPHPASQTSPDPLVPTEFTGEIYRCMPGTFMRVSVSDETGAGSSFTCAKGEALVYGQGGMLACAAETPERDCHERSLLRRYGPGHKQVFAAVAGVCEQPLGGQGPLELTGGVGASAY